MSRAAPPRAGSGQALACALAVVVVSGAGAGCQNVLGVEDVHAHLPRLDGSYLLAITRVRQGDGGLEDTLRPRAVASLDASTRTLDVSFAMLAFDSDDAVAEGSINGIEFPADSSSTTFALQLQVPARAVQAP